MPTTTEPVATHPVGSPDLGTFSISLAVKDLDASLSFYRTLGFHRIDGDPAQNWVILQTGDAKVGLFSGMFEGNLMTFNPHDARKVQTALVEAGYAIEKPAEEGTGPTHLVVLDPDGNRILVDQHGETRYY
jgi:catechol 2,3-dioxygenase-like lactoylglutathione lyase family enzyme